jgi:hypothetical protein
MLHRRRRSRSARKKSPTSAWRRSIFSTRKAPATSCKLHAPVVVAMAVVAGVAAAAVVAVAVDVPAVAVAPVVRAAGLAARPGVSAASAKSRRTPTKQKNARRYGRVRPVRPGLFVAPSCRGDSLPFPLSSFPVVALSRLCAGFSDSLKNASARTGCHSSGRTIDHAPPIRKMIGETCVRRR